MILDDYRKGWALRYVREARDELKMSTRTSRPMDFIVDAARKAQTSIYYSLGEPTFIEGIVGEVSESVEYVQNPVLRYLVTIERILQRMEKMPEASREYALKKTDEIISAASEILTVLTSGD